jgi:RNA polymerase sigma factor (sigma-70 family)
VATPAQLISGCRAGDRESWAQLVTRYEGLVYTVARRNGLDRDDAVDVTQTTFTILLTELDRLREADRLPSWLAKVARREAWRVARRHKPQPVVPSESASDDALTDWERRDFVESALRQLGSPCRELLFWLFLDPASPSQDAVAERLGRAVAGIGSLRNRCLEKLRAMIDRDLVS